MPYRLVNVNHFWVFFINSHQNWLVKEKDLMLFAASVILMV